MYNIVKPGSQEERVGRLILAAVLVLFLPALPFGNYLAYPFVILSTWFHEMGHGLTALALGFGFEQLEILPNGSGLALTLVPNDASAISRALISAGGPLGPAVVGSILILSSSQQRFWKPALLGLAIVIAVSTLIWVRSWIGWVVLPLSALVMALIALKANQGVTRFSLQFIGLHAALSMFGQWDYLMMESAVIGGRTMLSDTGAIEAELFLPHWLWAAVIVLIGAVMIGASLKYSLRPQANPNLPLNQGQFRP